MNFHFDVVDDEKLIQMRKVAFSELTQAFGMTQEQIALKLEIFDTIEVEAAKRDIGSVLDGIVP